MKTVRDHIASQSAIPAPPPGATHVLVWEPYGSNRSQWALGALDAPAPDDNAALLDGSPDAHPGELLEKAVAALGHPVWLSSRFEVDGEVGHYVIPLEGGR
jgi:hypothetical protein